MGRLHPLRKFAATLGIALVVAVAVCFLPENAYQRWQLLKGTFQGNAVWMYERIHFDPRPIDVVFIGPSRTDRAVDALRLQQDLAKLGGSANVVNFAMPQGGRNVNEVIFQELLKTKAPKLVVIGVIEKPSRFGHPAFKYIAPRSMVAEPGYLGNLNYLQDLIYLPYRQMQLFVADLAPGFSGLTKSFDASTYKPDRVQPKEIEIFDGTMRSATQPATAEELERGVHKLEAGTRQAILPARLADVEFGDERYYIRQITAAAQRRGIKVAFLFIPYYSGPDKVQEEPFYRQFGPVWNASYLAPRADLYSDYAHLTVDGAGILTDWLAPFVAQELSQPEPAR
jgi:hypothetical protein